MIYLTRVSTYEWEVAQNKEKATRHANIEKASMHLTDLGVTNDDIDDAVIQLTACGHDRAVFSKENNKYKFEGTYST